MSPNVVPLEAVFAPVRSQTAFEETVDRLGTAIKLGVLAPGAQLPAERELCARLGIARSTLRQALTALTQSGHVFATRGRGGGTFVSDPQPPADPPSAQMLAQWRDTCDQRLAIELGVAVLAADRARGGDRGPGSDNRPDRLHRPPARGAGLLERPAPPAARRAARARCDARRARDERARAGDRVHPRGPAAAGLRPARAVPGAGPAARAAKPPSTYTFGQLSCPRCGYFRRLWP